MSIREQLKTTFLGLAGLLTKMNLMDNKLGDVESVLDYIESGGMPEIDAIAKQGTNPNATNTTILEAVNASHISVIVDNTVSSVELEPNKVYVFTNRTSDLTLTLQDGYTAADEFHFFIEVGSTLPTITLPAGLTWYISSPIFTISSSVEVSILNNCAVWN